MNIAIMGAGGIANAMAYTVNAMDDAKLYAIGSRSLEKAREFAAKYNIEKAYGSYEDLVKDDNVDLVYIATPHSHHYENAKLCIEHGRAVLCEKAFTVNAKQAEEIFKLAAEKNVFITEAFWTRFMPSISIIKELVDNEIGTPYMLTAQQGCSILHIPRIVEPELAGGALLDSTVYPINFALMMFGWDYEKYNSSATFYKTGVDITNSITFMYPDGKLAVMNSSIASEIDSSVVISGTEGRVVIDGANNPRKISLFGRGGKHIRDVEIPKQISGYEYEVRSSMKAIKEGRLECDEMPHEETLKVMRLLDQIRCDWNFKYPFEE